MRRYTCNHCGREIEPYARRRYCGKIFCDTCLEAVFGEEEDTDLSDLLSDLAREEAVAEDVALADEDREPDNPWGDL